MGLLFQIKCFCLVLSFPQSERWLSGLKQWFAKPPKLQKGFRGFESLSLRHILPVWVDRLNLNSERLEERQLFLFVFRRGKATGAFVADLVHECIHRPREHFFGGIGA